MCSMVCLSQQRYITISTPAYSTGVVFPWLDTRVLEIQNGYERIGVLKTAMLVPATFIDIRQGPSILNFEQVSIPPKPPWSLHRLEYDSFKVALMPWTPLSVLPDVVQLRPIPWLSFWEYSVDMHWLQFFKNAPPASKFIWVQHLSDKGAFMIQLSHCYELVLWKLPCVHLLCIHDSSCYGASTISNWKYAVRLLQLFQHASLVGFECYQLQVTGIRIGLFNWSPWNSQILASVSVQWVMNIASAQLRPTPWPSFAYRTVALQLGNFLMFHGLHLYCKLLVSQHTLQVILVIYALGSQYWLASCTLRIHSDVSDMLLHNSLFISWTDVYWLLLNYHHEPVKWKLIWLPHMCLLHLSSFYFVYNLIWYNGVDNLIWWRPIQLEVQSVDVQVRPIPWPSFSTTHKIIAWWCCYLHMKPPWPPSARQNFSVMIAKMDPSFSALHKHIIKMKLATLIQCYKWDVQFHLHLLLEGCDCEAGTVSSPWLILAILRAFLEFKYYMADHYKAILEAIIPASLLQLQVLLLLVDCELFQQQTDGSWCCMSGVLFPLTSSNSYWTQVQVTGMLSQAALFASRGVKCSILTTPGNTAVIRPAVDRANASLHCAPAIDISTVPFPDVGLPPGVESVVGVSTDADRDRMLEAINRLREPFARFLADCRPDAAVADSFYPWAADAAAEHGVPRLCFLGTSMFARACHDSLLRNIPPEELIAGDDGSGAGASAIVSLPGLPHRVELRRGQVMDPRRNALEWSYDKLVNAADRRSYGELFNSFAGLEPDYVEHYRTTLGRRVWIVGPVAHASEGSAASAGELTPEADRCLRWLDGKPDSSVVYLSFGTLARFTAEELRELARGLQRSGRNFVWVIDGANTTDASEWMPEGFAEIVDQGECGIIFRGWAPQRLILDHPAVGGFVTHCGWNSVLEAVSAGVPLVTWPRYSDQFYNEKLIIEVLKVGVGVGAAFFASKLDVRDEVISGEKIAEGIDGVMGDGEEAEAIRKKALELRQKARSATEKGGSSYDDVGRFINELMARRSNVNTQ